MAAGGLEMSLSDLDAWTFDVAEMRDSGEDLAVDVALFARGKRSWLECAAGEFRVSGARR